MKYDIIHLNNHMYMVDKEIKIKHKGDWVVETHNPIVTAVVECLRTFESDTDLKVLASTDPSLGLPLLPEIKEDAQELAYKHTEKLILSSGGRTQRWWGFIEGYEAASAKKWTDDDIITAIQLAKASTGWGISEILRFLKPKPIAVEVEMEEYSEDDTEHDEGGTLPGSVQSEMRPKVVNNIVIVRRWIYEN
jgi:hypothetical protein